MEVNNYLFIINIIKLILLFLELFNILKNIIEII